MWNINRSITGVGLRETLFRIQKKIPDLKIFSVPSGTKVFDWTVPKEWSVSDAYIVAPDNKKLCNFHDHNLHLVGYSSPFKGDMQLPELQKHLYSRPDLPDAIPYVTSYYEKNWGFCISHSNREKLIDGTYYVNVDTELFDGELNYGELIIRGASEKEVLLSSYVCHPSMANNELSGPTLLTYLCKWLLERDNLRHTYRIIFIPETIGSLTYLAKNFDVMKKNTIAGFNISCVGDTRSYSYLPSRNGKTLSDRVAIHTLHHTERNFKKYRWIDRGSDERQYCAPGIDLPIASIMRTKYGEYPEYHTSLDDLINVVTPAGLDGAFEVMTRALDLIERNEIYFSAVLGEPQMGKRGLYPNISELKTENSVRLMMDFLSYCDGKADVLEIANIIGCPSWDLYKLIDTLKDHNLVLSKRPLKQE